MRARTHSLCPLCQRGIRAGQPILPDFQSRLHAHVNCVLDESKARLRREKKLGS